MKFHVEGCRVLFQMCYIVIMFYLLLNFLCIGLSEIDIPAVHVAC